MMKQKVLQIIKTKKKKQIFTKFLVLVCTCKKYNMRRKYDHNYAIFQLIEGNWVCDSGDSETLLEYLNKYEIEIPEGCEFMRFDNGKINCWIYVHARQIEIKVFFTYD